NYSNICVLSCQFCAFAAKKRDAHAFEHAVSEIVQIVAEALPLGITEVHMVGGLHPTLKKDWYLDLLHGLRALDPNLHIKAFTAISKRSSSASIICANFVNFRMKPEDLAVSFHLLSSRKRPCSLISSALLRSSNCATLPSAEFISITSII